VRARRVFGPTSQEKMPKEPCGSYRCRRYFMTLREFGRLGGQKWSPGFASKLGKAASKLYREIYGEDPPQKRAHRDWRNKVGKYPCGILDQAYRKLTASDEKSDTTTTLGISEAQERT
jgi:hypothetical protein